MYSPMVLEARGLASGHQTFMLPPEATAEAPSLPCSSLDGQRHCVAYGHIFLFLFTLSSSLCTWFLSASLVRMLMVTFRDHHVKTGWSHHWSWTFWYLHDSSSHLSANWPPECMFAPYVKCIHLISMLAQIIIITCNPKISSKCH